MRILSSRDSSLAFIRVGEIVVLANARMVSQAAWSEYLDNMEEYTRGEPVTRIFNYSPTFAPSGAQIAALLRRHGPVFREFRHVAIVTASTAVRKVVNAIAWMIPTQPQIRAYHTDRAMRALEWLTAGSRQDLASVRAAFDELLVHTGYTATKTDSP